MQTILQKLEILRNYNSKAIFNCICKNQSISRVDLSQKVKMSATAITRLVNDFISAGMVVETGVHDCYTVGRKPIKLSIVSDCILVMGINIDVNIIEVGCVDLCGNVIAYENSKEFDAYDYEKVLKVIEVLFHNVMGQLSDRQKDSVIGAGVCLPGLVDWQEGTIIISPQLHWHDLALREKLSTLLNTDVLIDNNVKGLAVAEVMFGQYDEDESLFILEVGSGVGSAFVQNGKVLRGTSGILGEIGHSLAVKDGVECDCGRKGCLQAYTCISGLEKRLGMPIEEIMQNRGEKGIKEVLDEAVLYLATSVANVVNYYNPSQIIVYGDLFDIWSEYFDRVMAMSRELLWQPEPVSVFNMKQAEKENRYFRVRSAAAVLLSDIIQPEAVITKSMIRPEKRFR